MPDITHRPEDLTAEGIVWTWTEHIARGDEPRRPSPSAAPHRSLPDAPRSATLPTRTGARPGSTSPIIPLTVPYRPTQSRPVLTSRQPGPKSQHADSTIGTPRLTP